VAHGNSKNEHESTTLQQSCTTPHIRKMRDIPQTGVPSMNQDRNPQPALPQTGSQYLSAMELDLQHWHP
jgi:hypothetical protein